MRVLGSPGRVRRRGRLAVGVAAAVGLGVVPVAVAAPPAAAAVACSVAYTLEGQWDGGFQAAVTVTNSGDPLTSWTLGWTFADGQTVSQLWNGRVSQRGAAVTVASESYNGSVATGGTVGFGFLGTWSGRNTAPTAFTLNGTACTGPNTAPSVSLIQPMSMTRTAPSRGDLRKWTSELTTNCACRSLRTALTMCGRQASGSAPSSRTSPTSRNTARTSDNRSRAPAARCCCG